VASAFNVMRLSIFCVHDDLRVSSFSRLRPLSVIFSGRGRDKLACERYVSTCLATKLVAPYTVMSVFSLEISSTLLVALSSPVVEVDSAPGVDDSTEDLASFVLCGAPGDASELNGNPA
jgi:hypothetical protein